MQLESNVHFISDLIQGSISNLIFKNHHFFIYSVFGIYKVCLMGHTWYIHLDTIGRPFIHTNVSLLKRLSMPFNYLLIKAKACASHGSI